MATTHLHDASFEKSAKAVTVKSESNYLTNLMDKLKFNYFGMIAMTITIGSILGGLTAMYIFQNNAPTWELGICMAGAMANNVSAIGQAPAKWVANIFVISTLINILLILVNIL